MDKTLTLAAIGMVAVIMTLGVVAPALANPSDEGDVAVEKSAKAIEVACEKIHKEMDILDGLSIAYPALVVADHNKVCSLH